MATATETIYRVYRLPKPTKKTVKEGRIEKDITLHDYLGEAIDKQLPKLVEGLKALGIVAPKQLGPSRLPMSDALLKQLRKASNETGLPTTTLLIACLDNHATKKKGRKAKKGGKR